MTLDEAKGRIGWRVLYHAPGTDGVESGVIVGCSKMLVYVRYGDDQGTKGTYAQDLTLMADQS